MRAYYFEYDVDFGGIAVIARNSEQAKKLLWNDPSVRDACNDDWVYMSVRWLREANVEGLDIGDYPEGIDSIERNIFESAYDECPICGKCRMLSRHYEEEGRISCRDCDEKLYQKLVTRKRCLTMTRH